MDFDESANARRIAKYLGTDHQEWIMNPSDALDLIPKLSTIFDEPFADVSQLPTLLVAQLAKMHVTVSLSGDGGDELFGGYHRYRWAPTILRCIKNLPLSVRHTIANGIECVPLSGWNRFFSGVNHLLPDRLVVRQPSEKLLKISRLLDLSEERDVYRRLVTMWDDPVPVFGGCAQAPLELNNDLWHRQGTFSEKMMWMDAVTYLPDDILVKVDRSTMACSLEGRAPLLDHRIVDFALSLPPHMKIRNGRGKWVLRELLDRYIPRSYMEQPKTGFGLPIHEWLRGPLREWGESLLNEKVLQQQSIFDAGIVRGIWQDHLSGRRNSQDLLWGVLMFQTWLEEDR